MSEYHTRHQRRPRRAARPRALAEAATLFDRVEAGDLVEPLRATTVTAIHYIVRRDVGAVNEIMRDPLRLFEVPSVNRSVLEGVLAPGSNDFEDAVLHEAERLAGARAIVTRVPPVFGGNTTRP